MILRKGYCLQSRRFLCVILLSLLVGQTTSAQEDCPWYKRDVEVSDEVKSKCICATNPSYDNQLSVQCQEINAQNLVSVLIKLNVGTNQPLELLYLNGSRVTDENGMTSPTLFGGLKIISLQLSGCKIKSIHKNTFDGMESHIKHISLSQNELSSVPVQALDKLHRLSLLDLSYNKITKIDKGAFQKLTKLGTLKLNDNNLELHPESFIGLEGSLRNLNLKGTRISVIPDAIANLSSLAFLDLAQNRLRELEPLQFFGLHSLTALNLERNLLQTLPEFAFNGINDTLSSLSLLNNLITHFPERALHNLKELRVLDLGFNLLTEIPSDAFLGLTSLTLLALDGNPLASLSESSFALLNTTLRGLSVGGRFLNCDCRVQWILEWIQLYDLQVTSRERNPQFCGTPSSLRSLNFYQIHPDDLTCKPNGTTQGDYDVDLSPEDIALLGMGSSPLIVSQPEPSSEEHSNEQDTSENKTTFTLEVPSDSPRNNTSVKYIPRRTRPNKFPRFPLSTSTSTASPSESSESNDGREVFSSSESKVSNSTEYPTKHRNASVTTPQVTLTSTKSTPVRNPPIRPNHIRQRITPKVFTSTLSSVSSSVSNQSSTTEQKNSSLKPLKVTTTTITPPFVSTTLKFKSNLIPSVPRNPTSKVIDAVDIDDSKIPVISGVGSAVSSSNLHTGSIMTVKQPNPIQTHTGNGNLAPKFLDTTSPTVPHHGLQTTRPLLPNLIFAEKSDISLNEIVRNGDSVTLHWESPRHISGFKIIYRLFGEDSFRHSPPLAATETEYRIKSLPHSECVVVCVVPFEEIIYNEISPSAASVPPGSQCREVKPNSPSALMNHMDKITIGASAAICATVIVAVLIFIGITRRSKAKRPPSTMMAKVPPTSFLPPSPGPQMITSGTYGMSKEWDQMSVVSTKSIPRARVYHGSMDGLANAPPLKTSTLVPHLHRNGPDGLSTHRSYTNTHHHHHNHSNHHNHNYNHHNHNNNLHSHGNATTAVNNYLNNQNRLLRTSLGSRASYDALNKLASARHSHHQFEHFKRKRASRISQSESLNTLNGYETSDNWTDHDMDFYVARNPTRHDLVQL